MMSNESQRLIVGRAGGSGGSWRKEWNALQRMNEGSDGLYGMYSNESQKVNEEREGTEDD
jgi:hypothetical protein